MKRSDRRCWMSVLLPLLLTGVFLSFSGTCISATLVKNGAVFRGEVTDKKGSVFPSSFRITSLNGATGDFSGEVSWPSLNAVHRIEGSIKGSTMIFKETGYIKQGGAHLNCEYAFVFDGQTLQGRWIEPRVDYGSAHYLLQ
jgi:hypothetical protein